MDDTKNAHVHFSNCTVPLQNCRGDKNQVEQSTETSYYDTVAVSWCPSSIYYVDSAKIPIFEIELY